MKIQSVGKDQQSLDRAGKGMSGSDVVIAPNILEQTIDTSRFTYTTAPEVTGSTIAAYEQNIMEAVGIWM